MKITGAIFDMDGTLTDSMHIWEDIPRKYLLSCGLEPRPELMEEISGMSIRRVSDYFRSAYGLDKTIPQIYEGIDAIVEPLYHEVLEPKPGVFLLLDRLKAQGVRMCVASATDMHLVEMVLEQTGLRPYFSAIFTCNSVGAGKELPLIYEKALEHLGTDKEETLVFEDAYYAAATAKKAGFPLVGVSDFYAERHRDKIKTMADWYIEDYRTDYTQF